MTRRAPSDLNIIATFYERWAPHEDRRREIADDHKEMFAEAKASGLNPKSLRKAFAEQYRVENQTTDQAEKRATNDGDFELYLSALARVREDDDEDEPEHDADGVIIEPQAQPVQTGPRFGSPTTNAGAVAVEAPAINSEVPAQDGSGNEASSESQPLGKSKAALPASVDADANDDAQRIQTENEVVTAGETATEITHPQHEAEEAGEDVVTAASSPDTQSEPAEGSKTSAAPSDRGAVRPAAATVAAGDRTKPNPWCMDPEECGVEASWNYMCLKCQAVKSGRERAGAALQ